MPAIGIDHVQFSVPDLAVGTEFLQGIGWGLEFREPEFATTPRPYFRETGKSMAYLKQGRAAIELIDGSASAGSASWTPRFSARLAGRADEFAGNPTGDLVVRVPELGTTCLCSDESNGSVELNEVILSSAKPEASAGFLESLGFRREEAGDVLRLAFPASIIGMGLNVTIVQGSAQSGEDFVDDLGLSLIALISKDLAGDVQALRAEAYETTETFDYTINGRAISNAIVRGPGGELIELIQIGRA